MHLNEQKRIASIDLIRGLIMVVMVIDHVRHFFHYPAFFFPPEDPDHSSLPIFFTRWITHYCAPGFFLLSGVSAWLSGRKRNKKDLFWFLFTRGLWLMALELSLIAFGWTFDLEWKSIPMQVIWALGLSMVCLSVLIYLPRAVIGIFSAVLIFGHNALDHIRFEGNVAWAILHDGGFFLAGNHVFMIIYPLVPWLGVMAFGYLIGPIFGRDFAYQNRRKALFGLGLTFVLSFFVLRFLQSYGDPETWETQYTGSKAIIRFFNPLKYPPSLHFLFMTLGPIFLGLLWAEFWKGKFWSWISVFGRVPFFFYLIHLYLIHALGVMVASVTGWGGEKMVMHDWESFNKGLQGFGYSLWGVYGIWILVLLVLYPVCRWYDGFRNRNKHLTFLSYL